MIEITNLTKRFGDKVAVDNITFNVNEGEIMGFLGPNGAGKSTTLNILTGYLSATSGSAKIDGIDVLEDPIGAKRRIGFLPEIPPLYLEMTVKEYLDFAYELKGCRLPRKQHIKEICEVVKITDVYNRKIKNLSKGYRQRVGIARALAVHPEFIVCDEPISALDVSIQAQVINMFEDLQESMNLTYLFIAHDLSVVKHISNRIGVMYLGRMVELADSYELTMHSLHPYTKSLISAIPIADPKQARASKRIALEGDVPSPLNPPSGCRFRTRCPYADEQCAKEVPEFKEVAPGHYAACHHLDKCN